MSSTIVSVAITALIITTLVTLDRKKEDRPRFSVLFLIWLATTAVFFV